MALCPLNAVMHIVRAPDAYESCYRFRVFWTNGAEKLQSEECSQSNVMCDHRTVSHFLIIVF